MANSEEKMQNQIQSSVSSIYSQLLERRKQERDEKKAALEARKAEKEQEELEAADTDGDGKLSKKEKRKAALENWQSVISNLTGDDLEYKSKKKGKKKYRKWIDDDPDMNTVLNAKPKKQKKKNYHKEFEPELAMLRTILNEQNKFNTDMQKRWQLIMGPANKDSQVPTKTMVELAAALNAGRSNALSMLNNIGNIKKSIADLTMKQRKLDADLNGVGVADNGDTALMGSNLASQIFGDAGVPNIVLPPQNPYQEQNTMTQPIMPIASQPAPVNQPVPVQVEAFDPASWEGHPGVSLENKFEGIPHEVVIARDKDGGMRFTAIDRNTGEELVGCPVPDSDISKLNINLEDGTVRGQFDEVYQIKDM